MLLYLSRNGTAKCSQLYGCVNYRHLITSGESAPDSRESGSLSRGKTAKRAVESTFSAGKCTKKAGKWFTSPPKRQMRNTVGNNIPGDRAKRKGYAKKKKGKLNTSHRYNHLPLLPSGPGGVQWELVVYDLPKCKGKHFSDIAKIFQSRLLKIRGSIESTDGKT